MAIFDAFRGVACRRRVYSCRENIKKRDVPLFFLSDAVNGYMPSYILNNGRHHDAGTDCPAVIGGRHK